MRLRYLTSAYHDLRLIFEYIARENPAAARRVISAIRKQAQTLTEQPLIGRPGKSKERANKCMGAIHISSPTESKTTKYRYSASSTAHASGRRIFEQRQYGSDVGRQ